MSVGDVYQKVTGSWVLVGNLVGVSEGEGTGGGGTSFLNSPLSPSPYPTAWDVGVSFAVNDLTYTTATQTYGGSSFSTILVCILAHTSEATHSKPLLGDQWTTYWQILNTWGVGLNWSLGS